MSPLASLGFSGGSSTSGLVVSSTGATKTTYGIYTVLTFSSTSGGTLTVTANPNSEIFSVLAIGGGAGGNPGYYSSVSGTGTGGSGGGPGAILETSVAIPTGTYNVTIGTGGSPGGNGGTTSLGSLVTANGGTVQNATNSNNYGFPGIPGGIGMPGIIMSTYSANGTLVLVPATATYTSTITGSAVTYGQVGASYSGNASATTYGGSGAGNTMPFTASGSITTPGGSGYQGLLIVRYRT
jgi:hypothetical protein